MRTILKIDIHNACVLIIIIGVCTIMSINYSDLLNCDNNEEYMCSNYTKSKGFTPLMKLVMSTKLNPNLNKYIKNHIDIINEQNEKGWTALMLACRNSNIYSSFDTVKILLEHGSDVNIKTMMVGQL